MKKILPLLSMIPFAATSLVAAGTPTKPNIVLFLVDDMGWQDTSVPFWTEKGELNMRYRTPNMERLARMGVKFTNAYACPVSSPSRCSLMSGANAARHKVTNWTLWKNKSTDTQNRMLSFEEWNWNGIIPAPKKMNNAFTMKAFPQILKENGYKTIHIGKAHFGATGTPAADPRNIGFDVNIAGTAQGGPGSYRAQDNYCGGQWKIPDLEEYAKKGMFLTDALTAAALKEIDKAAGSEKPFFLYMSHYAVHSPYQNDPQFDANYPKLKGQHRNYATLIEGMDKSLGAILDKIEAAKISQNTVIMFMADNGGHITNGNQPARGGKGALFEGGIHEPMMVVWPGKTKPNSQNATPVIIEDFYPTILELAGIKSYRSPQVIDGKSFVPAILGKKSDADRPLIFHFPNQWGERTGFVGAPASAIRIGKWKLVYFYEKDGETMLFDLDKDIGEKNNLLAKNPAQAKKMAKILSDFLKKTDATLPKDKSSGKRCPYPDGSR